MTSSVPAKARRGFQIHAFVCVATVVLLVAINFATGAPWWVQWPFLGWGIGILAHWWFVLGPGADKRRGVTRVTPGAAYRALSRVLSIVAVLYCGRPLGR